MTHRPTTQDPRYRRVCISVASEYYPHNFSINRRLGVSKQKQSDDSRAYFTISNDGSHLPVDNDASIMTYHDPSRLHTKVPLGNSSGAYTSDTTDVAYNYVFRELTSHPTIDLSHDKVHLTYDFVRLVGQGSFGHVYLALHRFTGERVAIKVQLAKKKSDVAGFDNAVSVLETIQAFKENDIPGSDYLCAFKTSMKEGKHLYTVFEFANGGDLSQLCDPLDPMSESDAKRYIKMILEGYSALYGLGYLHRDIKPANILLHYDDAGDPHVKLADFGLTKQLPPNTTTLNTLCGTEAFSSPTAIRTGQRNWKTDLYAIGVTTTSLLSGVHGLGPEVFLGSFCKNTFSAECCDFLKGLFGECIEVHDALEHPWFTSVPPTSPCEYGGTCQCPRYANEFRPNGCQGSADSYFARYRSDSEQYETGAGNPCNTPKADLPTWKPNPSSSVLAAPPKIVSQSDVATIRAPPRFTGGPHVPYATQSGVSATNRKRGGPNSLARSVGSQESLSMHRAKRPRTDCDDVNSTAVAVTSTAGSQEQRHPVAQDHDLTDGVDDSEDEDMEIVPIPGSTCTM
ncbi:kinase-like protein [Peniophora sp. CONT]|nr:kinase-like protein [Peniophora sp. CONT]